MQKESNFLMYSWHHKLIHKYAISNQTSRIVNDTNY